MNDRPGYMPPVQIGEPMRASGIGQVIVSRDPRLAAGDIVEGLLSWQDFSVADRDAAAGLRKIDPRYPLTWQLGVLGITGITGYIGMTRVGEVKAGQTVVVSGAAGATGSVASQVARLAGARVIGIAGGADKCRWLTETAGLDAAIDYRSERVIKRLAELCPNGVDLFFDNVGGETLDAVLANLAMRGRIVICGGISSGYGTELPPGPKYYMQLVFKSARMEGFLVLHYAKYFADALEHLAPWVQDGRIRFEEDIVAGLENAPAALRRLFEGANRGKQILKVADPED
jgi:NADPH-dependent curcumin reductase CurA